MVVNGFKKKRCIWTYDRSVFSESDFGASLMTDIPQTEREPNTEVLSTTFIISNIELATAAASLLNSQILSPTFSEAQPNIQTPPNC